MTVKVVFKRPKLSPGKPLQRRKKKKQGRDTKNNNKEKKTLLPVMRPAFNMREILKNCILLEDHLMQTTKRCCDCISKHCLTIESLAEEAITLECPGDPKKKCPEHMRALASTIRIMHHALMTSKCSHEVCMEIGRQLRQERKKMMKQYATLPIESLPDVEAARAKKIISDAKKRGTR